MFQPLWRCASGASARLSTTAILALAVSLIGSSVARSDEPARSARRFIPAGGLAAYLEYEGLDAQAHAWEATAAHDILIKTRAGSMLVDVFRQVFDGVARKEIGSLVNASDITQGVEYLLRNGVTLGCYGDLDWTVVVLPNLARPENAAKFGKLRTLIQLLSAAGGEGGLKTATIRGRTVYQMTSGDEPDRRTPKAGDAAEKAGADAKVRRISAWREGNDWIIVVDHGGFAGGASKAKGTPPDRLTQVLDCADGKAPNVTTHPGFLAAVAEGSDLKNFEPNGMYFIENNSEGEMVLGIAVDLIVDPALSLWQTFHPQQQPAAKALDPTAAAKKPAAASARPSKDQAVTRTTKAEPTPVDSAKDNQPLARKAIVGEAGVTVYQLPSTCVTEGDDDSLEVEKKLLGVDRLERVIGRWGFQGRAMLTSVRFVMPQPRHGLVACLEQPSFRTDRLPTIPPDARSFVLGSFSPDKTYKALCELARTIHPDLAEELKNGEQVVENMVGLRLVDDLLRHVGPSWAAVDLKPAEGAKASKSKPRTVLIASVDDVDAFDRALSKLAEQGDRALKAFDVSRRKDAGAGARGLSSGIHRLEVPDRGYRIDIPEFRWASITGLPATWKTNPQKQMAIFVMLGRGAVVVSADEDIARRVMKAQSPQTGRWTPSGELARAMEGLPSSMTFLSVSDPELCGIPGWIAGLPDMIRSMITVETMARDIDNRTAWFLANLVGQPRPGHFWLRYDRKDVPREEDLRAHIFPSVLAASWDARGYRVIQREPIAFAGLASELALHYSLRIRWNAPNDQRLRFMFAVSTPRQYHH